MPQAETRCSAPYPTQRRVASRSPFRCRSPDEADPEAEAIDRIRSANEELLETGNAAAASENFAPGLVVHVTGQGLRGLQLVQGFAEQVRKAFHDPRVEVEVETLASAGGRPACIER